MTKMTRSLAICVVPTVIAVLAIYWFRKKKKIKPSENALSCAAITLEKQDESHIECTSSSSECTSDFANTLSDASSFASPVSSEKSLRTDSPAFTSLLNDVGVEDDIHSTQTLSNCIDKSFSAELPFARHSNDLYDLHMHSDISRSNDSDTELLKASKTELNSLHFEKDVIKAEISQFDKLQQFESPAFISVNDIKLHAVNENGSANFKDDKYLTMDKCIHVDSGQQNVLGNDNSTKMLITNLMFPNGGNTENLQIIEIDNYDSHSSVFDENSLSYVSDDSEGKQLAEYKNKDSLSSVLDESSLLSSFCDELEKSSDGNSSPAVVSKQTTGHYDSVHSERVEDTVSLSYQTLLSVQNSESSKSVEGIKNSTHGIVKNSEHCSNSINSDNLSIDHLFNKDRKSSEFNSLQCETTLVTSLCSGSTEAGDQVQKVLTDFKKIKSTMHASDDVQAIESSDKTKTVNYSDDFKGSSVCDSPNLKIGADIKSEFEILLNSPSSSKSAIPHNVSVESQLDCDTKGSVMSEEKSEYFEKSKDSKTDCTVHEAYHSSTLESSDITTNHLDAVADVVQHISTEFSKSVAFVLGEKACYDNLNLRKSPWAKKESLSDSNTLLLDSVSVISQLSGVTNGNAVSIERSDCWKKIDETTADCSNVDSNLKKSEKDISKNLVNKALGRAISSDSSSWGEKESRSEVTKPAKIENNGVLDAKTTNDLVYEFELPQDLCGRLIGKYGRHVQSIKERSNANVYIKGHPYDPLLKVVVVEGSQSEVNEALEIIRRKYPPSQFPTVTLIQTNLISSTGVSLPESLQLHLPEGASCDVILSSLVSAGHFFLQQPTHPTYPSLSTLDQCMINLYAHMDTPPLPQPIEAGVICAAPVYRGWYRAQVVYVCDNATECGIKYVDYGGFSQVPISSLRQIRSDFMSLPFQASECYLANVRPIDRNEGWSSEATSTFEELAQGQILQALLIEYAEDGIPCVHLYRVQGVSSTFINKELVERGLAVWVNTHWDPH